MYLVSGLLVGIVGALLVVAGAISAYFDNFFFPLQMKARGISQGFPSVIQGAMWSDLIVISPLLAAIVTGYAAQWSLVSWLVAATISIVLSFLLHFLLYLGGPPSYIGYGGKLTVSGWFHLVFTAYAFTILGLFAFATADINHTFLVLAGTLIALHIVFAQVGQVIAMILKFEWFQDKSFKYYEMLFTTGLIWLLIIWRVFELWRG